MFKKKPTVIDPSPALPLQALLGIKNLSPLRSSDRRKIADQIIKDYQIPVTSNPTKADLSEPSTASAPASSLTSIRNSLLPDNTQTARFTTTAGRDLRELQGIVYVGTHPDGDERVLWFKLEHGPGADKRLYPTVYTLWHNPNLVPLLYTPEAVKGAVVAVASVDKHTVPLFVGICEIDVSALGEVQGTKGHAVRGLHWEGDELWAWSSASLPGRPAPEYLEGWDEDETEGVEEVEEQMGDLGIADEGATTTPGDIETPSNDPTASEEPVTEEEAPTTEEIDEAFVNAFVYALYKLKQDNPSATDHGLPLPITASALIANFTTPYLPVYNPQQAQHYNIKKTSWKNVKKFMKHLDKLKLVKTKDRSGQETVILDVDFEDHRVERFVPYRLPSPRALESSKATAPEGKKSAATDGSDPSVGQTITVQSLYRPSGKLMPTIFPALAASDTNNFYKYSDVSSHLDKYLESQNPPIISKENRRIISLNPFLANTIFNSSSTEDKGTLARGKVTRDGLLKRLMDDKTLLSPYHLILKTGQTIADVKPKAGSPPKVHVTLEKRTGSKTVTKVMTLEVFGIIPSLLAQELQKKCAGSTSVTQATGAPKGIMEVLVQGDQRKAIETALVRRGLKPQMIEVVDKTKKKK
ncbi:hypothetical protein N7519_011538 [Penicillium mononematosum]|uniref:uncharacterized protein n=1 Tax=Penicillium mononematosum TaxID=268346 RepID=UPI0025479536|nr:uncharacterized protein N7519_011538 [Penicillium mononematosum]KAJ6181077.1 hypothetical protein N7519_011538 [Penicillium mononematosum]